MKYCTEKPFSILAFSCIYPPVIERKFNYKDPAIDVIKIIADYFKVSLYKLRGNTKKQTVVDVRAMAMDIVKRSFPDKPLKDVGSLFKRTHSAVIAAQKKVANLSKTDANFKKDYINIYNKITDYLTLPNN